MATTPASSCPTSTRARSREGLFWGAFINTGQTCAALKRLYVHADVYDEVCAALVEVAQAMPMGRGLDEQNVLGPLQNRAQYDVVARLVDAARDAGAKILIGGDPDPDAPGHFYPVTLVADVDDDNPLVAEEQFGPALPIVRYERRRRGRRDGQRAWTSVWVPRSGAATGTRRAPWPPGSRPAPSGSTPTAACTR